MPKANNPKRTASRYASKGSFRYSDLYYSWRNAALRRDFPEQQRLARMHDAQFMPKSRH